MECSNGKYLPLMHEDIPEEFRRKAERELNETKENVEKGLAILRDCIKREKLDLSSDEVFLIQYLRQAKFDFKKAEDKLKRSVNFFKKFAELLALSNIKRIQAIIDHRYIGLLPFRDKKGRAVVYARASALDLEIFDEIDGSAAVMALGMFASLFSLTSICGISYLADAKPKNIKDFVPIFKAYRICLPFINSVPYRIKRIDTMNMNVLCRCFYAAVKPILPSKIKNRVHFYDGKIENLLDNYPLSILPTEFGGTMGPLEADAYRDRFLDFVKGLESELVNKTK